MSHVQRQDIQADFRFCRACQYCHDQIQTISPLTVSVLALYPVPLAAVPVGLLPICFDLFMCISVDDLSSSPCSPCTRSTMTGPSDSGCPMARLSRPASLSRCSLRPPAASADSLSGTSLRWSDLSSPVWTACENIPSSFCQTVTPAETPNIGLRPDPMVSVSLSIPIGYLRWVARQTVDKIPPGSAALYRLFDT